MGLVSDINEARGLSPFTRARLVWRDGKKVRAHWRGDASLGIKQSRYKVVA